MDEIFNNNYQLKKFMREQGVAFNKRLGQNFLMKLDVLNRIVKAADVDGFGVLEVGAGLGNLTNLLFKSARKVVALELDLGLFSILKKRFAVVENLVLVHADVLKINLKKLFDSEFVNLPVKICANLPYYITSNFLATVLEQRLNLDSITVMVQKEAAARFCAKPGSSNCGAISYLIHYFSVPKILFNVSRFNFCPVPKVDSCVVNLQIRKSKKELGIFDEQRFFQFIRVAFSQRRKILISPIAEFFNLDKLKLKQVLNSLGLNSSVRAQELSLEQFAQFFNLIYSNIEI